MKIYRSESEKILDKQDKLLTKRLKLVKMVEVGLLGVMAVLAIGLIVSAIYGV